jgi:hypothetical protein
MMSNLEQDIRAFEKWQFEELFEDSQRVDPVLNEINQWQQWQQEQEAEQWAEDAWLRAAEYDEENQYQLHIDDMRGYA